ncbi:flap endonuclease Xni [Vibrio aestuarianus]|uniref:Flap endonuclease Xni n=1 Tax=Vibrio aestuarianus TaxID=28171 RepID=A0A9X4FKB1_9VIBR|nr:MULTISPECIES: flap endonuclease Xni [Vibrio]MDE1232225.1 flap endonuclease Xni [Vibrio aestuarianus]MDE1241528.1 flap endonuclease Xni [Vibrio aestuarianus]MDE1264942.1 flap endonuclease Xni [Vibrio aestuarianus]MDE1296772.1 flap endonuclease Xni [Vibrio aestuarianus]MDE1308985.1 flap endonuclease Xni [Vibrio aestuarianus]
MSLHLVIIDALNLIRRVHSAQPDPNDIVRTIETTSRTLHRIINEAQPTHIIAVFDHHLQDRGWRAEILPSYKEGRKPMPEPLQLGLESIQQAWWELGIDSLLSDGDEADDLVATLATKVASHGEKVTIISTDKGYCQLLSPTLQIRDYFQHRWLDAPFIEQEFGVKPQQLTNYWGLTGMSSSQVPGIPGVGPKAAKEILTQFDDIEQAYASDELAKKYRKKFDEHIEMARICKQVATLKTDIELGFNLQDIRFIPNNR